MRATLAAFALAGGLCALAGCATVSPVRLGPPPEPVLPSKLYKETLQRSTRHAHLTNDWDTALDGDAVLLTPEYRAAFVGKMAAMRNLPRADRDKLAADQAADAEAFVEVLVMLQTSRWDWNDLATSNSVWTITFLDDQGRSVQSKARIPVEWKVDELTALVPEVTPFTRAWRVRFPRTFADGTDLLRRDATWLGMKFAGPLGEAFFRWDVASER